MGKICLIIIIALIALFIFCPLLGGEASIPSGFSASEIGHFVGSILEYWLNIARQILKEPLWAHVYALML